MTDRAIVLDTPNQIYGFRLAVIIKAVEMKVKYDCWPSNSARQLLTVRSLRQQYPIGSPVTFAQALDELKKLRAQVDEGTKTFDRKGKVRDVQSTSR